MKSQYLSVDSVKLTVKNIKVENVRELNNTPVHLVRALASHQYGPGSIPGPDAISGLSLCWFSSLLRRFFAGFSGFPPSAKTNIQLIPAGCKLCSKVTHGPYSGCQRRQCMLSVGPCWAASLLYFATAISDGDYYYYFKVQKPNKRFQREASVDTSCYLSW